MGRKISRFLDLRFGSVSSGFVALLHISGLLESILKFYLSICAGIFRVLFSLEGHKVACKKERKVANIFKNKHIDKEATI